MDELELNELKEWLALDGDDTDITLKSLISTSKILIKQSTGVIFDDIKEDTDAYNLYKTLQKYIITDLYENRTGASISPLVTSLYAQLEAYKLPSDTITTGSDTNA